jgi:hypothetical protein
VRKSVGNSTGMHGFFSGKKYVDPSAPEIGFSELQRREIEIERREAALNEKEASIFERE